MEKLIYKNEEQLINDAVKMLIEDQLEADRKWEAVKVMLDL